MRFSDEWKVLFFLSVVIVSAPIITVAANDGVYGRENISLAWLNETFDNFTVIRCGEDRYFAGATLRDSDGLEFTVMRGSKSPGISGIHFEAEFKTTSRNITVLRDRAHWLNMDNDQLARWSVPDRFNSSSGDYEPIFWVQFIYFIPVKRLITPDEIREVYRLFKLDIHRAFNLNELEDLANGPKAVKYSESENLNPTGKINGV